MHIQKQAWHYHSRFVTWWRWLWFAVSCTSVSGSSAAVCLGWSELHLPHYKQHHRTLCESDARCEKVRDPHFFIQMSSEPAWTHNQPVTLRSKGSSRKSPGVSVFHLAEVCFILSSLTENSVWFMCCSKRWLNCSPVREWIWQKWILIFLKMKIFKKLAINLAISANRIQI